MTTFAERLRSLRGQTPQEAVAAAIEVSQSAIGKWERAESETIGT